MNRPQVRLSLVILAAVAMTLLCLAAVAQARPTPPPIVRYVAPPPTGSDAGDCTNPSSPCATVQYAIDQAYSGDEIHVAGGTYAPGGTVAAITKSLIIEGGYGASFSFDPDLYPTVFDAGNNDSVVKVANSGFVFLHHLTLTNGNGAPTCGVGTGCGGGIYANNADIHIGHLYIHHNVADPSNRGWGGGIYAIGSSVEIWGSRINNNTASGSLATTSNASGGGIYVAGGTISLRESEIRDNVANASSTGDGQGGGIHLTSLTGGEVLSNTIRGNSASPAGYNGYGNGIYMSSSSSVYVAGNLIRENSSPGGQGGGISSNWDDIHLDRNRIIDNTSPAGGGIYIRPVTAVTLSNNLIANNSSVYCCGGVYVVMPSPPPNSKASLVNNTIVHNGNHAIGTSYGAVLDLTNNLLAFHQVGIRDEHPVSSTITADHNLFWNTTDPITGTNPVQADPLLSGLYGPLEGSPALDAGIDVPLVTVDLVGHPRPSGSYDIGAWEGIHKRIFLPLGLRNH